jgi:hypothetical protein
MKAAAMPATAVMPSATAAMPTGRSSSRCECGSAERDCRRSYKNEFAKHDNLPFVLDAITNIFPTSPFGGLTDCQPQGFIVDSGITELNAF